MEEIQQFLKGTARVTLQLLPQDVAQLRSVLPPSPEEIQNSLCVLFVGGTTKPTRENIATLGPTFGPVLVSKNRIGTMINFLIQNNPWYQSPDVTFSEENLNACTLHSIQALHAESSIALDSP